MKIAVNNEVAIPISNVVAKPLIGPVPKMYNTSAVNPVVIFASNIAVSYTHLTLPTIYSV